MGELRRAGMVAWVCCGELTRANYEADSGLGQDGPKRNESGNSVKSWYTVALAAKDMLVRRYIDMLQDGCIGKASLQAYICVQSGSFKKFALKERTWTFGAWAGIKSDFNTKCT